MTVIVNQWTTDCVFIIYVSKMEKNHEFKQMYTSKCLTSVKFRLVISDRSEKCNSKQISGQHWIILWVFAPVNLHTSLTEIQNTDAFH